VGRMQHKCAQVQIFEDESNREERFPGLVTSCLEGP
jgi:hypothetical protein